MDIIQMVCFINASIYLCISMLVNLPIRLLTYHLPAHSFVTLINSFSSLLHSRRVTVIHLRT